MYIAQSAGTKWLGFTVLCFIPTMLAGAAVTYILVPPTRTNRGSTNPSLDELEKLGNQSVWGKSIFTAFLGKWLGPVFRLVGKMFSFAWRLLLCRSCRKGKTDSSGSSTVVGGVATA